MICTQNGLKEFLSWTDETVTGFILEEIQKRDIGTEGIKRGVSCYFERTSKKLRPALVYLSGFHFGAIQKEDALLRAASAAECFHTWTLVHDDIIDQDILRRGQKTAHILMKDWYQEKKRYHNELKLGQDMAILAGDVQQGLAVEFLMETFQWGVDAGTVFEMLKQMEGSLKRNLIEGEALDIELSGRKDPLDFDREEILKMMRYKTGELLGFSAYLGIAIAGIKRESKEAILFLQMIDEMSVAFQLQDDILGIFGEEETFGKPIASDLHEQKKTLLIWETKERLGEEERNRFLQVFKREQKDAEDILFLTECIDQSGAKQEVKEETERYLKSAMDKSQQLADSPYKKLIQELLEYLYKRKK